MSHVMGVQCATHNTIMMDDSNCPERGCLGHHGFTYLPCDDRCPNYENAPVVGEEEGPAT